MIAFLLSPLGKIAAAALLLLGLYLGFRVWLHQHDQATLSGYVLLSEKTAAEAKAAEMQRQRDAAAQVNEEDRKRLEAAKAELAKTEINREADIRGYELLLSEKNRKCLADAADVDFLQRH